MVVDWRTWRGTHFPTFAPISCHGGRARAIARTGHNNQVSVSVVPEMGAGSDTFDICQGQLDAGQVGREETSGGQQSGDLLDLAAGDVHDTPRLASPLTRFAFDKGLPQHIQLEFPSPVIPRRVRITFQGGFVGTRCNIEFNALSADDGESTKPRWHPLGRIYPQDINGRQCFDLVAASPEILEGGTRRLKLSFEASSDFFGRITIYDLQVDGVFVKDHSVD